MKRGYRIMARVFFTKDTSDGYHRPFDDTIYRFKIVAEAKVKKLKKFKTKEIDYYYVEEVDV